MSEASAGPAGLTPTAGSAAPSLDPAVDLGDPFALLGLSAGFDVDRTALEQAYRRVQGTVHPDRFAAASDRERRVALQWATAANEAVRTLRDPVRRATWLCERAGHAVGAESNTAMPASFLGQQMMWREALDEARGAADASALAGLRDELDLARAALHRRLAEAIDAQADWQAAVLAVRELMFVDRFAEDVEAAEYGLD